MLLANKLAECFCTIVVTSISVSKLSPFKNCCDPWKRLPVYQTPPPSVIPIASIEPDDPAANIDTVVVVLVAPWTEKLPTEVEKTDWLFPFIELVVIVILDPVEEPDKIKVLVLVAALLVLKDADTKGNYDEAFIAVAKLIPNKSVSKGSSTDPDLSICT